MQDERDRAKIDGQAAFASAAFLIGVGSIYLLARVGAPDGLVHDNCAVAPPVFS